MKRVDRYLIIILLLSVFAWAPLANGLYFFKAHDAPHSVFFLMEFDQAIKDGAWYPRWGIDFALGYGYPLFNMYAPLAYFLAEAFVLLGMGYVGAVKVVYALTIAGSGVTMYLFGRRAFGPLAGLAAGLVYMYLPYHIVDVYVRSAYAESVAFAFVPLVLWAFHGLVARGNDSAGQNGATLNVVAGGLSYAALILTHNGTALIFTPVLLAYCACQILMRQGVAFGAWVKPCLRLAAAGSLSLGLSAIFWLPMLAEAKFVQVSQWTSAAFDFSRHFVYGFQFFSPYWGYEYSGVEVKDGMGFQIGLAAIALAFLSVVAMCRKGCSKELRWQGVFFVAITLVLAFLMTGKSAWLWQMVPVAPLVQFPWRLLGLTAVSISVLAGLAFALGLGGDEPDGGRAVGLASITPVLLVIMLASYGYLAPQYTEVRPVDETPASIIQFETFSTVDRVGATVWVKERPDTSPLVQQYLKGEPLIKAVALTGGAIVETIRHGGASETVRVRSASQSTVLFYTYYYPGWRAYIDGVPAEVYPSSPQGLVTLDVPPGEHVVAIRFEDTPVRQLAVAISGLTLALVLLLFFWRPLAASSAYRRLLERRGG